MNIWSDVRTDMDSQHIEEMILVLENSDATELEVKSGDSFVRVVKSQRINPKVVPATKKISEKPAPLETPSVPQSDEFLTAPMVGMFYSDDVKISQGSQIAVGQKVGVIESMKLHNELVSRVAGVVLEVLVENDTPVEYGQPLFRVGQISTEQE